MQPGKQFVQAPSGNRSSDVTLTLGDRQFAGALQQPAFLVVRLDAGPAPTQRANTPASSDLDRIVFTPLAADHELAKTFPRLREAVAATRRASGPAPRLRQHARSRRRRRRPWPARSSRASCSKEPSAISPARTSRRTTSTTSPGVREIGVRSEYTDGRDMPRLLIRSVEFEGPFYDIVAAGVASQHLRRFRPQERSAGLCAQDHPRLRHPGLPPARHRRRRSRADGGLREIARLPGRSFQDSVKDALLVVLTSPQFLFLIENSSTPAPGAARRLRTGVEALVLPLERPAGSQDAAAGRGRVRCASSWMPK